MTYRLAKSEDFGDIAEYLVNVNYFNVPDVSSIGGIWIIARDSSGKIRGTIWFFGGQKNMFADYWSADIPSVAGKLCQILYSLARDEKIERIHGIVSQDNPVANKFLVSGIGVYSAGPYNRIYKEVASNG